MAVYERNYGRYQGALTPPRFRFMILPKYSYREVFESRVFVVFFSLCFLVPFAGLLLIYLHHNLSALQLFQISAEQLKTMLPINATFFRRGLLIQTWLCFLMTLSVGPALVAPDLRNNGLPLYLSRPFSRGEYVLGKMMVLIALMSAITWVPGLLLFFFQSYLEGGGWMGDNLRIGFALFVASWAWILVLSLVSLAISAWVKWKPVARVALLVVFFVFSGFAAALNGALDTWWGWMFSLPSAMERVADSLFDVVEVSEELAGFPVWAAWTTLIAAALISLWLLSRRVRAYEVVR
jgi:ABC-2 type transport system permease protein